MDVVNWMFGQMQDMVDSLQDYLDVTGQKGERSETCGGFQAFAYADLPRASTNAMSDGTEYIDVAWCSDGRKSGEGAGAGTGQPVYYDATIDDWRVFRDDSVVTI